MGMLGSLLTRGPNSPFYKALIDSNLGYDYSPSTGYDSNIRYTFSPFSLFFANICGEREHFLLDSMV